MNGIKLIETIKQYPTFVGLLQSEKELEELNKIITK
jgi:hypothetical protein